MLRSVRLSHLFSVTKTRNRNIVTVYGDWQAIMENPGTENPGTDPGPKGTPHAAQKARLGTLRSVPYTPYTLNADPVLAKASTLSSNSKPAVRGLWLRTYHL